MENALDEKKRVVYASEDAGEAFIWSSVVCYLLASNLWDKWFALIVE
jgi:hypothetical protein